MIRIRTRHWAVVMGVAAGLGHAGCGGHTVIGHEPEATGGAATGGTTAWTGGTTAWTGGTTAWTGGTTAWTGGTTAWTGGTTAWTGGTTAWTGGTTAWTGGTTSQPACTAGDWDSFSEPLTVPTDFPPSECSLHETVISRPCDLDVLREGLVGTWYLCSSPSAFSTTEEVGLVFADDGTWSKVFADSNGDVVRSRSFEESGTWDVSDGLQINVHIGAGGIPMHATFAKGPRKIRIGYTTLATYVWAGPPLE
ncbi:MAG TPA: hypothetical protein VG937_11375 [Polyangiaceae bacterium]|nr:hypothetical protein [Polyangiaceae bacterium]